MTIYTHADFYVEVHESEIPWLKLFTTQPYKELTDAPKELRSILYEAMESIEMQMREYYQPEKVNIAAFGNYLPRLHIHVMARFKQDSYFPEPMWGVKQREAVLELPPCEPFYTRVQQALAVIAG
jgi:diadenosine tetraphosphate (Ap4A) HIT family hydrolase